MNTASTSRRTIGTAIACCLLSLALASGASADDHQEDSRWSVGAGMGFNALGNSTNSFLMGFDAYYQINDLVAFGPVMQIGVDGDFTLFMLSGDAVIGASLNRMFGADGEFAKNFKLFGSVGMGFGHLGIDAGPIDTSDQAFLFNFGAGAEYRLSRRVSLLSRMYFNVTPTLFASERFNYSWELIGARIHF